MNRYLVFAYSDFYPFGGMDDCVLKTNDYNEATKRLADAQSELGSGMGEGHIYDIKNDVVVEKREWDSYSNEVVK